MLGSAALDDRRKSPIGDSSVRCGLIVAAVVVFGLIVGPRSASAAAGFVAALPEPGSTYQGNPPLINARYTERLDPARSSLDLIGPDGSVIRRGGVAANGSYATEMWIEDLPTLDPGTYTIRSRATSALDGVVTSFAWTFTVEPIPPDGTPEPQPICTDGCNGHSTDGPTTTPSRASAVVPAAASPIPSRGPDAAAVAVGSGSALLVSAVLAALAVAVIAVIRRRR